MMMNTFEGIEVLGGFEVADENASFSVDGINDALNILGVDDLAIGQFGIHRIIFYIKLN